jgi:hypothetical protein
VRKGFRESDFLSAHCCGYFTLSSIGTFRGFQTVGDSFHVLVTRQGTGFGLIVGFIECL